MTQQEAYDFLRKNKNKWFSSKDVAAGIGNKPGNAQRNLQGLFKSGMVLQRFNKHRCRVKIPEYKYKD